MLCYIPVKKDGIAKQGNKIVFKKGNRYLQKLVYEHAECIC